MRKWQILEFNGKPYYAFVPEDEMPIKEEDIPEYSDSTSLPVEEEPQEDDNYKESTILVEPDDEDSMDEEWLDEPPQSNVVVDVKPIVSNGKVQPIAKPEPTADLYQIKVEAGMVLLEKLNAETMQSSEQASIDYEEMDDAPEEILGIANDEDDDNEAIEDEDEEIFVENTAEMSKKSLKCKACSETFDTNLAFRKHVAWTHKKKIYVQEGDSYVCSVCDYRTQKKSQLAAHLERKHETWTRRRQSGATGGAANFPCQVCNFVCRSKHSLQSHFVRKHTDRYEHQCTSCDKKFKVKGDLTNHVRFHHKEKPVNCEICGKQCLNSGSLYVHQKWAHFKPKFECAICKRRMVTQENLDQHMVMQHEKREKIVCAECGKTFTKKDSFKRHMAVHTGAKPYNCVICNKPFARRSQLRQHLLIHTGKRPFVCDICGKAFTQKPGLICHRKTHPGKHPPLPVMPIGDIVKEFTESYLAEHAPGKKQEGLEDDADDPETEEEDEEYYEEEGEDILEEAELLEEDLEEHEVLLDE